MGIFENWVGFLNFVKIFSVLWFGWVPFGVCASVLAPCVNLNLFWSMFHHVHTFFYSFYKLVHVRCLTKCPSNILWLYWTQMISSLEFSLFELVSHALDVFNLLCSQMPCLAHTVHTLGISRASLGTSLASHAHTSINKCTAYAHSNTFSCFHALCVWLHVLSSLA